LLYEEERESSILSHIKYTFISWYNKLVRRNSDETLKKYNYFLLFLVFRKLAIMLHPDKTAVVGADEAFKTLGVARYIDWFVIWWRFAIFVW
jgi:hypothetical protein